MSFLRGKMKKEHKRKQFENKKNAVYIMYSIYNLFIKKWY